MAGLRRLRHWRGWETFALPFCLAALLGLYLRYDRLDPRRPATIAAHQGWWSFADQGRYLADTLAWAAGDLDPARHWYLPGYGLLGVPFLQITTANPYLLPDAGLLLVSLWLTAAIAGALLPGRRGARAMGAAVFLLTAAMPPTMEVWVTPWTTTPAAALILGCLLALLRFLRQPGSWRLALTASLCAAGLVAFRPSDAMLMLPLTALVGGIRLLTAWPGGRAGLRVAAASALGVAVPVLVTGLFYLAAQGWRLSEYLTYSALLGFDWRLLPLQWVTLVLDPQPMLPGGEGLLPTYPFIATGLAGMAACLAAPPERGGRAAHAVMAAASVGYGALYLCYRDLHPQGLWRYFNYHYFKWLLPIFGLYTVMLLLVLPRWRGAMAAACTLAAILPWQVEPTLLDAAAPPVGPGHMLALPDGLGIGRALVVAARGNFDGIYNGLNHFHFGPRGAYYYGANGSIAAYPIPDGLMLAPLRSLPPGPGRAVLDPRVTLDPAFTPRLMRLGLAYGRPCYLPAWLGGGATCRYADPIPPPPWPSATPIAFDAAISGFLTSGWSPAGDDTLWTEGEQAGLRGRLQPALPGGGTLAMEATAFVPLNAAPLEVAIQVGGVVRGHWTIASTVPQTLRVALPADAFGPDGSLTIELLIGNPRRPSDWTGSADSRLLGLEVHSVTIEPPGQ